MNDQAVRHWWLEHEEQCQTCLQYHAHTVELWCTCCDEALCALCGIVRNGDIFCPACRGAEELQWQRA